jgi:hypothetical protein
LALGWCAISAEAAPAGDPVEFLPFCGVVALGALGSASELSGRVWQALAHAAADPRWRIREAAAMAIQQLLRDDPHTAWRTLERWSDRGGWLLLRAVAAGVAHPSVLESAEAATAAVALHRRILGRVEESDERRSVEFRTLRQGLGYTLSVVAVAAPDAGFALLERLARSGDRDLHRIVRSNLGKARLTRRHGDEVARIASLLES